jgi:surface polysaccharide O-acyltransferase-like enzyme
MVVTMHAPMPNENAIGIFNAALSYYNAPCIGLFFMVSGALLLPIKGDVIDFLKRRFAKIAGPTIFWSIFYIACRYFFDGTSEGIAKSILSIPFSPQGHGVMWFMYTLAGLYLIAPIISAWLERASKKEIEIYLSIWILTTCYPLLKLFLTTQTGETSILYYLSGFAGYFLLGYYLKKYPKAISYTILLPAIIISICAPIVCKILHFEVNMYDMFWYLSIFVVVMAIGWFCLINNKVQAYNGRNIPLVSNLSFGIYLTHIFVMRYILWKLDIIQNINSYIIQTIIVIIATFIGSLILCYAIARLPFAQYIIGYKIKSNK